LHLLLHAVPWLGTVLWLGLRRLLVIAPVSTA
jgi:hypothetical protein